MDDRLRSPLSVIACLVFTAYVVAAFALGELYPLSRFHMFSRIPEASSRILARALDGSVHDVHEYGRWSCGDAPLDVSLRCDARGHYPDIDRRVERYVRAHPGARGEGAPVEIVRRTYSFPDPWGPPAVGDCVIAACTAARE